MVVVKLSSSGRTPYWVMDISLSLMNHMRMAGWLSKSLIFLFVSSNSRCSRYQPHVPSWVADKTPKILSDWVKHYHSGQVSRSMVSNDTPSFDFTLFKGIIRDAMVIDMLHLLEDNNSYMQTCSEFHCQMPATLPKRWEDGYVLSLTGQNGLLPNMDIPSALLSMEPSLLHLETTKERQNMETTTAFTSMLSRFFNEEYIQTYCYYLAALMQNMKKLLWGADGWHGIFLNRNIDSFTLRPQTPSLTNARKHQSKGVQIFKYTNIF